MDDINFRNFCYENFDTDNDGKVSIAEADVVSQINVFALGIQSLTGIEYFTNLTALNCNFNMLSSLCTFPLFYEICSLAINKGYFMAGRVFFN